MARRIRMVVVEDDAAMIQFLTYTLHEFADLLVAKNARDAERIVVAGGASIDGVIVDCLLGGSLGVPGEAVALLGMMRERRPSLALLAMDGEPSAIVEALRAGAWHVLRRPLDPDHVRRIVARVKDARLARVAVAIRRVLEHVALRYAETLPLADIARLAGMSRSHFCHTFREVTGRAFGDHVREVRLSRAAELLRTGERSMTQIAQDVGFYDLPHFDKAFRRRFGVAPSAFAPRPPAMRRPTSITPSNGESPRA